MRIVRTAVKSFNPTLLSEQIAGNSLTSGITSIAYQGFDRVSSRQVDPKTSREEYGSTIVNGVRTPLLADPGEIHFEGPSDPGADLDTVITNHLFTDRTQDQTDQDSIQVDRTDLAAGLRSAPDLTQAELEAMGRITLDN